MTRKAMTRRRARKLAWPMFKYARRLMMFTLNYLEVCRLAAAAANKPIPENLAGGIVPMPDGGIVAGECLPTIPSREIVLTKADIDGLVVALRVGE